MAVFSGEQALSGLAGEIRSSISSEQFDLSNYTETRARDLVAAAFSSPLTAPTQMIRFTFIVGGGKLVRSKYAEDLPKWFISALRDVGYAEDRSAAETYDSQGTFKQQHDTGQNLKYVIVYPRVTCSQGASGSGSGAKSTGAAPVAEVAVDTKSPEYQVTSSDLAALKELFKTKTQSWRQRKKMLKVLQDGAEYFQSIEQKLITGAVLTPKEQAAYESNSGADTEKLAWLQGEIKKMVDEGKLTASEKEELLASLEANLKTVNEEIAASNAEGKPKKAEKLEEKKQGITSRKATVQKIEPIQHRLKHSEDIIKLRMRLIPLQALEDKGRSMSLTLADLKTLEEKSDIEAAIAHAEALSKGWFETEEDFHAKCLLDEKEAKAKYSAKVKSQGGKKPSGVGGKSLGTQGRTGGSSSASSWSTVGVKKSGGGGSQAAPKKAASGFAAAFGADSDSD